MQKLYLIIAVFVLTGCAGLGQIENVSNLSVEQLRGVNDIELLNNDDDLEYVSFGVVKGISCKGSALSGSAKEEAAITQLKIKAVKVGANALYTRCFSGLG